MSVTSVLLLSMNYLGWCMVLSGYTRSGHSKLGNLHFMYSEAPEDTVGENVKEGDGIRFQVLV